MQDDTTTIAGATVVAIRLYPGDPTPDLPYVDDDWFRFYAERHPIAPDSTPYYYEVHELDCDHSRCAYRDEPCPWHPAGCECSDGWCQA